MRTFIAGIFITLMILSTSLICYKKLNRESEILKLSDIKYLRDERTNLCFVYILNSDKPIGFSNIQCSKEILEILK